MGKGPAEQALFKKLKESLGVDRCSEALGGWGRFGGVCGVKGTGNQFFGSATGGGGGPAEQGRWVLNVRIYV